MQRWCGTLQLPRARAREPDNRLAKILSVSERTVSSWLSRIDKDSKAKRDRRIVELWMACHSTDEIAKEVDVGKADVSKVCSELEELPISNKPAAEHAVDFDPPLYNVWKQQTKSEKVRSIVAFASDDS